MKKYHCGIFIGKFYPMHLGHIQTINKITEYCDHIHVIFYKSDNIENKLSQEFGIDYNVNLRVADAQKLFQNNSNIFINIIEIPNELSFPRDFEKIKSIVINEIGHIPDLQIFGKEEESIYSPYAYAKEYITGEPYYIDELHEKTLHATLIRLDYMNFSKYLPSEINKSIDSLMNR